ncbi:hypothetical protein Tco_0739385 [Tanacetum coccineum]
MTRWRSLSILLAEIRGGDPTLKMMGLMIGYESRAKMKAYRRSFCFWILPLLTINREESHKQKSHEELEAKQNEDKVKEHLMAKEIEKLVERTENVEENIEVDSSTLRQNDNQNDPGTWLEPMSNKESPEVEITAAEQHVNVIEEEEETVKDDYELRRREKGKHVEESRNTPSPTTIRSPRIHSTLISSDTEKLQELTVNDPPPSSSTPSSSSPKPKLSASQHILSLFKLKTGHFKRYKSFFDEFQGR